MPTKHSKRRPAGWLVWLVMLPLFNAGMAAGLLTWIPINYIQPSHVGRFQDDLL